MSEQSALTGLERCAILLLSLGEDQAANVLKFMGPKEVQKLGSTMTTLQSVSKTQVTTVLESFVDTVEDTALGGGAEDYVKNMMISALGEDKAGGMIDRIMFAQNSKGLEALKWMDARAVAEVVRLEHPQIISIVLAYLDPDQSAEVMQYLPERVRSDVLMRIASLEGIPPSALHELDEIMEKQFAGGSSASLKSSNVGGVKTAADILNNMDSTMEGEIMDAIKDVDAELGQSIQDLMFVFDNLSGVDDRGIQTLLREVSTDSLILALKGADESIKEKILKNMSKRASEMLRDDMEARGPVKLSEVEAAQKEILTVARRMAESGEINLGGGGEQYV